MSGSLSILSNHLWPQPFSLYSRTTTELLLEIVTCVALIWCLRIFWSRRRMYQYASKIPGPFSLPLIGSALPFMGKSLDTSSIITTLFRTYPGIFKVWFGPKLMVGVSDPKYLEILLPNCLQKEYVRKLAKPVLGHGLLSAPLDVWKRHRKILTPTFNQKILNSFVAIFSEQGDVFVEQLKRYSGKGEFDVFHMISRCTLDIICETAMGLKMDIQVTDHPYSQWTDRAFEIVVERASVFWYYSDLIFDLTPLASEFNEIREKLLAFTNNVVKEKKKVYAEKMVKQNGHLVTDAEEKTSRKKAFLDYLIEITSEGSSKFTDQELTDEVTTFIIAGSDTTATTNSFVFITLGLHQDMQQKIYEEVMEVVGPSRQVEPADLPHLKYMEMFIKETLRIFPVATLILRDIDVDVDLGDYVIPAGTTAMFGMPWTHTDERHWPEPYKFNPDRFLPEEVSKRDRLAYIPFSYGPRNCIGMKYAMMAMKTLLSTIIRKYRISTSYKNVEDVKLKCNMITRPRDGFKVAVELRSSSDRRQSMEMSEGSL